MRVHDSAGALSPAWDEFLSQRSGATIFHTASWQQVLGASYPYRFCGLEAVDAEQKTVGLLPLWLVKSPLTGKRMVSAPFSYICPPVAADEAAIEALLEKSIELTKANGAAYYELKSPTVIAAAESQFAKSGQYETFHVDLRRSEAEIWNGTHKGIVQRGVNKARKDGVIISIGGEEACLREFHHLNLLTCRRHGIPAQPLRFHQEVWRRLKPRGEAEFLFAEHGEKRIAAVVIFYYNGTATYMYGASDEEHLALRPNHLLIWEAILRAKAKGMHTFDLGRVSDDNPGLKEFKQRWGAATLPLYYNYWPEKRGVGAVNRNSLKFKVSTFMFSKLPLAITGRLTWLYKHLA